VEEIALDRGDPAWARVDRDFWRSPGVSKSTRSGSLSLGGCAFAVSYRFYSKWARQQGAFAERPTRHARSGAKRRQRFCADESLEWFFGHHFRCHRRARPVSRTGVGGAVRIFTGHALDPDRWATLGGRRTRHDCAVRLGAATRKNRSWQMVKEEIGRGVAHSALISVLAIMIILLAVLAWWWCKALAKSLGVSSPRDDHSHRLAQGAGIAQWPFNVSWITVFGIDGAFFACGADDFLGISRRSKPGFRHGVEWLAWAIMAYGLVASILPVWMLLTPRDYLSTFLKNWHGRRPRCGGG